MIFRGNLKCSGKFWSNGYRVLYCPVCGCRSRISFGTISLTESRLTPSFTATAELCCPVGTGLSSGNSFVYMADVEFDVLCNHLKNTIFWDITSCRPLKVNRRFGATFRLHLQGRKISRVRNQRESRWKAELCFHAIPEVSTVHNHRCENLRSYICNHVLPRTPLHS
jgi:hypothetical protein